MKTDLALPPVAKQVPELIEEADSIEITSADDLKQAVEALSRLNKQQDAINEVKDQVLRPILDAAQAERARWKPIESLLAPAIITLRAKITKYQTQAKRDEELEKEKIAARVGEGKGKLKAETAIAKMENVAIADKNVSADSGSVSFITKKNFEVTDLGKLAREAPGYIVANEVKIRAAMKEGTELPGVRYFTEEVPRNLR